MLKGNSIYLRALEKEDASTLFIWENNPTNWKVSNTEIPFSMHTIHQLIEQQSNIRNSGQLRMIICLIENDFPIGAVDLYDVSFRHGFASLGILIAEEKERRKGFAKESMELMIEYTRDILEFSNLQCSIHDDNEASINFFKQLGFKLCGTKKNWLLYKGKRINEVNYQLCLRETK